jgi:hypothetical protein
MKCKILIPIFKSLVFFCLSLLLGILLFNLIQMKAKLRMIEVVKEFHRCQINNDKKSIDMILTDSFVETGAKHYVQTPDFIRKRDILNTNYPKGSFSIEANYIFISNILSSDSLSLSFVKVLSFPRENSNASAFESYFVTYMFEETSDGLKIKKIVRNF